MNHDNLICTYSFKLAFYIFIGCLMSCYPIIAGATPLIRTLEKTPYHALAILSEGGLANGDDRYAIFVATHTGIKWGRTSKEPGPTAPNAIVWKSPTLDITHSFNDVKTCHGPTDRPVVVAVGDNGVIVLLSNDAQNPFTSDYKTSGPQTMSQMAKGVNWTSVACTIDDEGIQITAAGYKSDGTTNIREYGVYTATYLIPQNKLLEKEGLTPLTNNSLTPYGTGVPTLVRNLGFSKDLAYENEYVKVAYFTCNYTRQDSYSQSEFNPCLALSTNAGVSISYRPLDEGNPQFMPTALGTTSKLQYFMIMSIFDPDRDLVLYPYTNAEKQLITTAHKTLLGISAVNANFFYDQLRYVYDLMALNANGGKILTVSTRTASLMKDPFGQEVLPGDSVLIPQIVDGTCNDKGSNIICVALLQNQFSNHQQTGLITFNVTANSNAANPHAIVMGENSTLTGIAGVPEDEGGFFELGSQGSLMYRRIANNHKTTVTYVYPEVPR